MINKKNKNSSFSLIEKTKISIQRRNVSIHRKEKKKSQISKKLTLFILRISKLAKSKRDESPYIFIFVQIKITRNDFKSRIRIRMQLRINSRLVIQH